MSVAAEGIFYFRQWEDKFAWFARGAKICPTFSEATAGTAETCLK